LNFVYCLWFDIVEYYCIIFQGVRGAYSESAAQKAYPNCEAVPCEQFDTAFEVNTLLTLAEFFTPAINYTVRLLEMFYFDNVNCFPVCIKIKLVPVICLFLSCVIKFLCYCTWVGDWSCLYCTGFLYGFLLYFGKIT
jgi:hypothetical protein